MKKESKHSQVRIYILFIIIILGFMVSPDSFCEENKDKKALEVAKNEIAQIVKEKKEIESKIKAESKRLKKFIEKFDHSENHLKGLSGLGRIEQLELKANLYSVERQVRRKIEKNSIDIITLIDQWSACQRKLKEQQETLKLREKIISLKKESNKATLMAQLSRNDYFEYTVQKDSTLRNISALADVYGDPNLEAMLYEANRDIVENRTAVVPAGTVLKVMRLNKDNVENFDELEEK
jgi:hypothetical protein